MTSSNPDKVSPGPLQGGSEMNETTEVMMIQLTTLTNSEDEKMNQCAASPSLLLKENHVSGGGSASKNTKTQNTIQSKS